MGDDLSSDATISKPAQRRECGQKVQLLLYTCAMLARGPGMPMMQEEVRQIAALARLALTDDEIACSRSSSLRSWTTSLRSKSSTHIRFPDATVLPLHTVLREDVPGPTLPQRPLRWSALAREMGTTGRLRVPDLELYWEMRASPVSTTYLIRGMVMEVSAILVAANDLVLGSVLEDPLLVRGRHAAEKRHDQGIVVPSLLDPLNRFANVAFGGHEDQDIPPAILARGGFDLMDGRQDLVEGQPLTYGQSITDGCLGWEASVAVLERLAAAVRARRLHAVSQAADRSIGNAMARQAGARHTS